MKIPGRRLWHALALMTALAMVGHAHAQSQADTFPSKPINMIVPYAAGGSSDFVARLLAQKLGEHFGKAVVVESRAGAGATIGTGAAAQKGQGGHIALLADNAQTSAPALYESLPYDSINDFAVVGFVGKAAVMLFSNQQLGVKDTRELIEKAKANPSTITIGTGHGSPSHLITEYFNIQAGVDLTVVPYKGSALALNDLLAGHIDLVFTNPASAATLMNGERIVPLGQTGDTRDPRFPNMPTFKEQGVNDFEVNYWFALLVPADTPEPALEKWREALAAVLADKEVQEKFDAAGLSPYDVEPQEAKKILEDELQRWQDVVKAAKLQTN